MLQGPFKGSGYYALTTTLPHYRKDSFTLKAKHLSQAWHTASKSFVLVLIVPKSAQNKIMQELMVSVALLNLSKTYCFKTNMCGDIH